MTAEMLSTPSANNNISVIGHSRLICWPNPALQGLLEFLFDML